MIERTLEARVLELAQHFPIVTITGPRQSGKTTLCQMAFPQKPYVSLEALDTRDFAASDPRGFLAQFPSGAVIDEVQRVPDLLSYLQVVSDESRRNGEWILTGSQNLPLLETISQSLAGRSALVQLLPPDLEELRRFPSPPTGLWHAIFTGAYPRIHQEGIAPGDFLDGYVASYVERDVRQVLRVGDLASFQTFLRLCSGRTGQLVNLSDLGSDAGVSYHTARAWLSVLEAGFIVFLLRPYFGNLGKRLVKRPKLFFLDSGLLCYLLGIREPAQLETHPLRGAIFETWVVSEVLKSRLHRAKPADLLFYRDAKGLEVDLLIQRGHEWAGLEIKSARTVTPEFWGGFAALDVLLRRQGSGLCQRTVVYGGETEIRRSEVRILPWNAVDRID
jgi:predicted AAA+ superfamily ATPase